MEKGEGMKWSGMEWNGLANYNLSNRDDTLTGKNNLPLRDWEGGGANSLRNSTIPAFLKSAL